MKAMDPATMSTFTVSRTRLWVIMLPISDVSATSVENVSPRCRARWAASGARSSRATRVPRMSSTAALPARPSR